MITVYKPDYEAPQLLRLAPAKYERIRELARLNIYSAGVKK
jgi:hypothetical protein